MISFALILSLVGPVGYAQTIPPSMINYDSPYYQNPYLSTPSPNNFPSSRIQTPNPQGIDSFPLSNAMLRDFLPRFSYMEYGFLYEFSSKQANRSLFYTDLFLPIYQSQQDILFCQSTFNYNSFSNTGSYENGAAAYRIDGTIGGGYRFFLNGPYIRAAGFNGFFDTSQISGSWYNSWGVGFEMIWGFRGNSLLDFSVNQYGNQFQDLQGVTDLWRKGDVNFDMEGGYSRGFFDGVVDLRLKGNAYQFSLGDNQSISGGKGGVELRSGDGLLKVSYEIGNDRDKGTYNTISASMNVGFQVESLLSGRNPFSMPQPIFQSPERNPARILNQKVKRNTNLPDKVVTARKRSGPYFRITMNGPYISGTGTYTQSSNTNGTLNITYVDTGGTLISSPSSYTVSIVGDVTGLTFPLTATITPNATQPTGQITVRQSGVANQPETVTFNSPSDLTKTIPTSGASVGSTPVPLITRTYGVGSAGNQGNITITGPGVQTLTVAVNSVNEPTPGVVYFTVTMNGTYGKGSGTYTQSSNTSGTWNITPAIDGVNYHTSAASYTVTLSGDTASLPFPVTATITPNATQPTGQITVRQSGVANQPETITFANSGDLVKTIPPSGTSVGTTAAPDVIRQRTQGSSGNQGTITVAATGIQTLTINVVSVNEPTPGVVYFTVTMNGTYGYGSGTYTQSTNTSGIWNITPAIDGVNFHTSASSYTVTLSGDTGSLTYPVTATITPSVTVTGGQFIVSQSGTAGLTETVTFANSGDLVKTIPPNGNSTGTTAVPDIIRQRTLGSAGSQGTITVTATSVQTLTIYVVSGNEPTPGAVYFTVTMNGTYGYGSGTYTQPTNTSGTWTITPEIDGANYHTSAASYTVTLSGDTGSLTYPLTATITPNVTVDSGQFIVRQSGVPSQSETVQFANATDLVKTIPSSGTSVGTTPVPDITRPRTKGGPGSQGNITVTASGVSTLTIDVFSVNEPPPGLIYFAVTISSYQKGSGTYTQPTNTSGTWTITPAIDGANYHTIADSYTVTLSGDTGGIAFPVNATITPSNAIQPTSLITVRESGVANQPETISFANSGDLVKIIPPSGGSGGTTKVPDVTRPTGSGSAGNQGTITVTATSVQTLTIDIVSVNEPVVPYFVVTMGTPTTLYTGNTSSYTSDATTGTWNIHFGTDGGGVMGVQLDTYSISLGGDTSSLTFPLDTTIVPAPLTGTRLRVSPIANDFGITEVAQIPSASGTATVPPGNSPTGTEPSPEIINDTGGLGPRGIITISATNVRTLTINIISDN